MAEVKEAIACCDQLLQQYGLWEQGWRTTLDRAKMRAGCCRYNRRTISLSAPIIALNSWQETLDTIRHEVAHALVGPGHAHDQVWQEMAVRLGAQPKARCTSKTPRARYQLFCMRCGSLVRKYHRLPKMDFSDRYSSCCGPVAVGELKLYESLAVKYGLADIPQDPQ
jgi:predicted SprT family Zn-dependent metalloprotease